MSNSPAITAEDFDAMIDGGAIAFPDQFLQKSNRKPLEQVVESYGPLDGEHVSAMAAHIESGGNIGEIAGANFNQTVKALRHTHHRLAQLLAGGMDETVAAKLCNYTQQRVSHLKADPAFAELLNHYAGVRDDEFADFASAAANLSLDFLGRLQEMLDEAPEKFGPGHLMDAIKLLADRTGHAPITKTHNVNVNVNLGDRLRAARERSDGLLNIFPPKVA